VFTRKRYEAFENYLNDRYAEKKQREETQAKDKEKDKDKDRESISSLSPSKDSSLSQPIPLSNQSYSLLFPDFNFLRSSSDIFEKVSFNSIEFMREKNKHAFKNLINIHQRNDKKKDSKHVYFLLPEYAKTTQNASDLILGMFEREIWSKILILNADKIKRHNFKISLENLEKK
jgi:hypothetical protein